MFCSALWELATDTDPRSLLEEDEIDLRNYQPAGGPIIFQALELPPQPKTINNWTIRKGKEGEGGGSLWFGRWLEIYALDIIIEQW